MRGRDKLRDQLAGARTVTPSYVRTYLTGAEPDEDGVIRASARIGGIDVPVAYLDSYVPAPGDVVLVLIQQGQPVVLGRIVAGEGS